MTVMLGKLQPQRARFNSRGVFSHPSTISPSVLSHLVLIYPQLLPLSETPGPILCCTHINVQWLRDHSHSRESSVRQQGHFDLC